MSTDGERREGSPGPDEEGVGGRLPRRALVTAFVAVTISFVAATGYSQYAITRIDGPALAIARNAAPSIQHLAAARAELRGLQLDLVDQLNAVEDRRRVVEDEVRRARARLDAHVRAYLATPVFDGERRLWADVQERIGEVDREVERVLAALHQGDRETARRRLSGPLDQAADRASEALYHSVTFNADRAAHLALDIEVTRHGAFRVAVVLNVICAVAALFAAVVVLRVLRSASQLARERSALLARQARELEAFAGRVAHDILSPLGTIALAFDLLRRRHEDSTDSRLLDRSQSSLQRVRSIVEDLLGFARSGAAPLPGERADLRQVAEAVAQELEPEASACRAAVRLELCADPPQLACSTGVLHSIVGNLVRNALKYLGDRPERTVVVRSASAGPGGRVRVEVEDSGPGIPAELQEVIFLPHVRGASSGQPGLGLGLATVKVLVKAHGGELGLISTPDRGSTFWFELPLAAGP